MKTTALFIFTCLLTIVVSAQTDSIATKKVTVSLYGTVSLATDLKGEALYVGLGGPKVGFAINKKISISVGFYPSFKVLLKDRPDGQLPVGFTLGAGPEITIIKWGLGIIAPMYLSGDEVLPAIGLSYRFK